MTTRTTTGWTIDEMRTLLSAISHDLRTPLSVITGRASVLRASVREDQRRDLDTIVHEAQRLSRTLENLLAVTDVEREANPRREWVPFEELSGAVLARLESVLAGRPLEVDVPDDLLAHVDPVLGELLLANLLDHAATHTPPGTPIELQARRDGASVSIRVSDRGSTAVRPTEHATRADGLGLAACRKIARCYGGKIESSTRDGGGTVVYVYLPDGEALPILGDDKVEVE